MILLHFIQSVIYIFWFVAILGSTATNKLYQLQQEVDALRVGKIDLQKELEALRSAQAGSSGANKEKEQEQK